MIILLFVVIFIFVLFRIGSDSTSNNPTTPQRTAQPSIQSDPNDPYNICCALACLATAAPYCKPGSYGYLMVHISDKDNNTCIHVSYNGFNYTDKTAYNPTWIDNSISDYLASIPFTRTASGALEITFNYCIDTNHAVTAIRKGRDLAKCPSDRCNLDVIHPKGDPLRTDIHFVTDM